MHDLTVQQKCLHLYTHMDDLNKKNKCNIVGSMLSFSAYAIFLI